MQYAYTHTFPQYIYVAANYIHNKVFEFDPYSN